MRRYSAPLRPGRLVRLATLARNGGNASAAARQLGIRGVPFCRWLRRLLATESADGKADHLPAWNLKGRGPRRITPAMPAKETE